MKKQITHIVTAAVLTATVPSAVSCGTPADGTGFPDWAMTGFERPDGVNPVISPDTSSFFDCPMRGEPVAWEESDTFNPAATLSEDGKIIVLYRAEDNSATGIGRRTSRIGYAESEDGLHFTRRSAPVLYPGPDSEAENECPGGCEDPRVAVTEDGTYVMFYTQWNRKQARLAVATSRDLLHWEKHGPAFGEAYGGRFKDAFSKSASIVTRLKDGKLAIAQIDGKYWMYWGEKAVNVATSENLVDWQPLLGKDGGLLKVMVPRPGRFDSELTECGPPALLTENGILLMYNGKNSLGPDRDTCYNAGTYCAGQALFDASDPTVLKDRLDRPFFVPEADFEKSGQYPAGTVFIEGLVFRGGNWFLYYGCADSRVAVAVL